MLDVTKITWLAWAAPLALLWGQFRDVLTRLCRVAIRTDHIESYLTAQLEIWLRENGVYLSGAKHWAYDLIHIPGKNVCAPVIVDARDPVSLYLVKPFYAPVLWDLPAGKVTYLVGTFDFQKVIHLVEAHIKKGWDRAFNSPREFEDEHFGGGFQLINMAGVWGDESGSSGSVGRPVKEEHAASTSPSALSSDQPMTPSRLLDKRWQFLESVWYDLPNTQLAYDSRITLEDYQPRKSEAHARRSAFSPWGPYLTLEADYRKWAKSRGWLFERGLAWRRGALLSGPPGTGKTEMAVALAKQFNVTLIVMDLAQATSGRLYALTQDIQRRGCCVLLIEDVDAVFVGRENVAAKHAAMTGREALSFEAFINFLGGAERLDGCYTIMTTNRPEALDEALTRKGRADLKLQVGKMCREDARKIANNMLREFEQEIDPVLDAMEFPATAADVFDAASGRALELWEQSFNPE